MIKSRVKTILLTALISSLILISCKSSNTKEFELELFKNKADKWGYSIQLNNKTIIYQEYIPCVEGNVCFSSKSDAKQVGELVLTKIQNHERPSITIKELEELNIPLEK
jgi:hypothetical protein